MVALLSYGAARTDDEWIRWACFAIGMLVVGWLVRGTGAARLRTLQRERDEKEQFFRALMDSVPANIYFKDRESKFLEVNHAIAQALHAGSPEAMVGKTDADYFRDEHAEQARADELRILKTGRGIERYIEKETFPDGSIGWVLSSKLPMRDKEGQIVGTFGISSDVTSLIETQNQLERERNTLRALLNSIPDSIFIRGLDGHYIVVNKALAALVGRDHPDEVNGKTLYDFFPKERAEQIMAEDQAVMEDGQPRINCRSQVLGPSGEMLEFLTTKVPVRGEDGLVFGIVGINRNVTELERARHALRHTEHQMQEIVDHSPSLIYAKSLSGHYLMINRRYEELFGLKADEVVGKSDLDLMGDPDSNRRLRKNDLLVVERGEPVQMDEILRLPDGDRAYVSVKFPLRDLDGKIYAIGGVSTDITGRKKAERELQDLNQELLLAHENLTQAHDLLIQAEKMESVGRLAAGVAHEVKNPLAMIGMGLELLARRVPPDDATATETIARMKRGIERAKKIVKGLVDYASDRRLEFRPHDPNQLVRGALELVDYELRNADVKIEFVAAEGLPVVEADQTRVEQVLVNLFINAMHAMDGPGNLIVRTELIELKDVPHDEGSRLRDRLRQGDRRVRISVADTGSGLAAETLGKLFDPFFTTKSTGKGTGLGLTVSRKIAELHGSELTLANRTDCRGAIAGFSLRVADPQPSA